MDQDYHSGLWPRQLNAYGHGEDDGDPLAGGLDMYGPIKPRELDHGRGSGAPASGVGAGQNGYQLSLLLQLPAEKGQSPFSFVCSSSGSTTASPDGGHGSREAGAAGLDRVCALRGAVVYILTFVHESDSAVGDGAELSAKSSVEVELSHRAERAVWNTDASCVVVGDESGRLHFITADGTLLFSQQVAKPLARSGAKSDGSPRAFHCIKFASSVRRSFSSVRGESMVTGLESTLQRSVAVEDGGGDELLAVTASLRVFHFANVPLAALEAACLAQDPAALKQLRAGISVTMADASSDLQSRPTASTTAIPTRADACLQSLRGESRVYLVANGGLSVWRRGCPGGGRSHGSRLRRLRKPVASAADVATEREKGVEEGSASTAVSVPAVTKLEKIDEVCAGTLFGGGGATLVQLSADGRWVVVADDRGGLSWWSTPSLVRLARWTWPPTTSAGIGNRSNSSNKAFRVADMVILAGTDNSDVNPGMAATTKRPGHAAGGGGGGGDPRPCVACLSAGGEVRVLRLGPMGVEELHRGPEAAYGRTGMLTVPSAFRHHFLLVSSDPAAGQASVHIGKEAVPRHRLQALLVRGEFDRALELARAYSMDETEVHAARLLSMLRDAGAYIPSTGVEIREETETTLPPSFFADVTGLLDRLDTAEALGRACVAATEAALPSLGDVQMLLEIVEARVRSFENAGTRVRNRMLEPITAALARLRTFELIEGGRGSDGSGVATPPSPVVVSNAVAARGGGSGGGSGGAASGNATSLPSVPPSATAAVGRDVRRGSADGLLSGEAPSRELDVDGVMIDVDDMLAELDGESESGDGSSACSSAGYGHAKGRWNGCGGGGGDVPSMTGQGADFDPRGHVERGQEEGEHGGSGVDGGEDTSKSTMATAVEAEESEVDRWLRFRTTDLVAYVGAALQAGDVHAASVVWRRHARADRGGPVGKKSLFSSGDDRSRGGASGGGAGVSEGERLVVLLPEQLASAPAAGASRLLGEWLRDEVLSSMDVAGAMLIRDWAQQYARDLEAVQKRPHGALAFARAVADGSSRVLGSAAGLLLGHRPAGVGRGAADNDGGVAGRPGDGGDAMHWKAWRRDGLDALERTLGDLVHAWNYHGLRLPLSKFESLPRDLILFRVLDRVQSLECLPREMTHHVVPMAKRYGLDPDSVLLDYLLICTRARGGALTTSGAGAGGLITEQRAVAVARCISAGEGGQSEIRSRAVLALANAASFPFSDGLRELMQDALAWGGPLEGELQDAARALRLSQIVQRYDVTGFSRGDAPRATRLLRYVLAQVHCPSALDDALQVAKAYSHLHERSVYVEFLENLASSYPTPDGELDPSSDEGVGEEDAALDASATMEGMADSSRLAADLENHRGRVAAVLRRVPQADERRVAEEVLLYLIRLLEELEMDAAYAGLASGQLSGCRVSPDDLPNADGDEGPAASDSIALEVGSDAEEAVLVAAAASAVVAFLRERPGRLGISDTLDSIDTDLGCIANDLRRITALQTEFGAFVSLATIRARGGSGGRATGGPGCWRVLKERLSGLEALFHEAQTTATAHIPTGGKERNVAAPALRTTKKGARAAVGGEWASKHKMRALPRLLHRARRLSELLGVPWSRVVSHLAIELSSKGKVPEAVSLCQSLFRDNRNKVSVDERAAALALRDTAVALSTFVASQAHSGALRADGQASSKARAAILQAMLQSVRGLRQSATLCGPEELPLTVDLLQGSEAVAAVLSRCDGGEELKASMSATPSSAAFLKQPPNERRAISRATGRQEGDPLAGLYKWYPGDGRVLPVEEALRLVSRLVFQEMRLRRALINGTAFADTRSSGASMSTETYCSRWEATLEGTTSPLLEFLQRMGAQQLCVRVVALMAIPPPTAVDVLNMSFAGLANKVLHVNDLDCPMAIGYMLALDKNEAYEIFKRNIRLSKDDYGRLQSVARVGMHAVRAWDDHDLLHQVMEVERDAHWWHVLTTMDVPFDYRGFSREGNQVPGEYQRSLVPALLERSGGDLTLTVEFCERYGVGEAFPCLLYVDNLLSMPCTSPHDISYQESIVKVLPAVHGSFLARLLRHMLDDGQINDRDYERLAFVHELLLSEKCQSEEEDTPEEKEWLEDRLDALEMLKAYTSPWPVDRNGKAINTMDDANTGGGKEETKGEASLPYMARPSVVKDPGHEVADNSEEVYARRLPFRALLEDPWAVLEPQLRPNSVVMLVPLAEPLRLEVGEFYARLVKGMLKPRGGQNGTDPAAPAPVFSTLKPWLDKIKNPALACMTAQTVAAGMCRDVDRLEALNVAIKQAVAARACETKTAIPEEAESGEPTPPPVTLLPLAPLEGGDDSSMTVNGNDGEDDDDLDTSMTVAEDVVEGLELRALRLHHLITAKECLGDDMAQRLSPYFSSSLEELLTKLLLFTAEEATDKALGLAPPTNRNNTTTTNNNNNNNNNTYSTSQTVVAASAKDEFSREGISAGGEGGGMFDFRRKASRALRAARSIAEQHGLDVRFVESLLVRLAKAWINQPKAAGGGGPGGGGAAAGLFAGGSAGGMVLGGAESVFARDAREERAVEDAKLALRAAFVLTKTFSVEDEGDGSVCDSIAYLDLKSRISLLLGIARDGRDGRVKFRSRLRALLALSALAPSSLAEEVMAGEKEKQGWCALGDGLNSLTDLRRNMEYMAELEEARLPQKLEEVAACPPDDIVRALRRDHRGELGLIPLLCDMLLDARCGDTALWSPILADACRYPDLCRVLILRVFPRLARSTVADAFARSASLLAPSWEEALRCPLEELKAKEERRRRRAAAAAARPAALGLGGLSGTAGSTSFRASLYAMSSVSGPGGAGRNGRARSSIPAAAVGEGSAAGGKSADDGKDSREGDSEKEIVDHVVLLLGACPFPELLDLPWFSSTLADLGPRFHRHAVRAALCHCRSTARTAAVLEIISRHGVAASVVLDELCPEGLAGASAGVGSTGDWPGARSLANEATMDAVFLDIDRRQAHSELDGTRHAHAMAMTVDNKRNKV